MMDDKFWNRRMLERAENLLVVSRMFPVSHKKVPLHPKRVMRRVWTMRCRLAHWIMPYGWEDE